MFSNSHVLFVFLNTWALIARKPSFMKNGIENIYAVDETSLIYQTTDLLPTM